MSVSYEERAADGLERLGLAVARDHLDGVAQRAVAEGWSYTHFLGYLLDGELSERHRRCVALNLNSRGFQSRSGSMISISPHNRASTGA